MPISARTIKLLFAKSKNQCAMYNCKVALIVADKPRVDICHIRARRKTGPRYDPTLTEEQKNAPQNLILLCPTCHRIIDGDPSQFTVTFLEGLKAQHELQEVKEISFDEAKFALAILEKHLGRTKLAKSKATAHSGGVAVSISGDNHGDINIKTSTAKSTKGNYPPNSIGADANCSGYIDELCGLYVTYMSPTNIAEKELHGRIGKAIKRKFRLRMKTRNHIPMERFWELVNFLYDKLRETPIGKKHVKNGTKYCSTFEEWRTTTR